MVLQNCLLPHGTREGGPLTESLNTRPKRQNYFPKTLLVKKVKEGDLRRLKCTALSGNPLPQLQWFAGGQVIEEGVTR